jgi:hypothetical protein
MCSTFVPKSEIKARVLKRQIVCKDTSEKTEQPGYSMDPNLFHLNWDRTFEALATIVVLAIVLERALAPVFENRRLVEGLSGSGLKEVIAFALAFALCWRWHFDAVSIIVLAEQTSHFGEAITAAAIAGGSKGAIKLFRDVLGFKSTAYKEYEERKLAGRPAVAAVPITPRPGNL